MSELSRISKILLFVACSSLAVGDWGFFIYTIQGQFASAADQQEGRGSYTFSLIEEEVKHKEFSPVITIVCFDEEALETSVAHLINDDDVRHLAYLPIFSPPPNVA